MQGSKLIINILKGTTRVKATIYQSSLHSFAFDRGLLVKVHTIRSGKGNGKEVSIPKELASIWVYMAYGLSNWHIN
jgi:hypothetical protein